MIELLKSFISFMIYSELLIVLAEQSSFSPLLYHETTSVKTEDPKKDKGKGKLKEWIGGRVMPFLF